jgi:acyl-CoA reductase-like NAD-dependent aldehyde dehydrogenase
MGKMLNAGQICLAPDYLLVPSEKDERRHVLDRTISGGVTAATTTMRCTRSGGMR